MSIELSFKVDPTAWHSCRELIGTFSIAVAIPSFCAVRSIITSHTVTPIEFQVFNYTSLRFVVPIFEFSASWKSIYSGFAALGSFLELRTEFFFLEPMVSICAARSWLWASLNRMQSFPPVTVADSSRMVGVYIVVVMAGGL